MKAGMTAVFYRDYRQRVNNIGFVFWDLLAPLAYLFLFGIGFERAMPGGISVGGQELSYIAFLLPGVLAMTTFGVAMNTSWGFFMDKESGILFELLTYPITRGEFLIGKICFNVLVATFGCSLAIAMGVAAMNVSIRWELLPLTMVVIAVGTAGWFFMFASLAIRLNRMDSFNTLTSVAYLFLMFLSPMFYPLATLPAWFRILAWCNPMTWQVDLLRFGLLGIGDGPVLAAEATGLTLFMLVWLAGAVRTINRVG